MNLCPRLPFLTALLSLSLVTACGGDDDGNAGDGVAIDAAGQEPDAGPGAEPCASTTPIERAPVCGAGPATDVGLPSGCAPTVDGVLHLEEWDGATCFNVGDGGDVVYARHAGDAVYLAFSATPACGCPMSFVFDPDGASDLDDDEFLLYLFDDPFDPDGDRADLVVDGGAWTGGTAPAGIVTRCPGDHPSPINYEIEVPFSALGIAPGSDHTFGFAVNHPSGGSWPAGLTFGDDSQPDDPSNWGKLSSPSDWQ